MSGIKFRDLTTSRKMYVQDVQDKAKKPVALFYIYKIINIDLDFKLRI